MPPSCQVTGVDRAFYPSTDEEPASLPGLARPRESRKEGRSCRAQAPGPNHRMLLWSNDRGGERDGQGRDIPVRWPRCTPRRDARCVCRVPADSSCSSCATNSHVPRSPFRGGKITEIDILADPERLSQLDLTLLDG